MKITVKTLLIAMVIVCLAPLSHAQEPITTLRKAPLSENGSAPLMRKMVNTDIREIRSFAEQPPIIPHNIRGYQIDLNSNKCLSCHSRTAIADSQAPMVSVTHFMDRDGQVLSEVTPRRYFCTQCHVPQKMAKPLVPNQFIDADKLNKQ